jgi:SAM-dependent methyltransferase
MVVTTLRDAARAVRDTGTLLLTRVGPAQSSARLERDAAAYWGGRKDDRWQNNSHWRGGSQFGVPGLWEALGREHLELYQRLRRASTVEPAPIARTVEWGCGGGTNAVAFAPLSREFVGVDVSTASTEECAKQVAAACPDVLFTGVLANVGDPEAAAAKIPRPVSLFLCLYVLELVPDKAYGLRLMGLAYQMLEPGGQAFVQVKYSTRSWRTWSRRRAYPSAIADTTYCIDEFWTAMEAIGFRPESVFLVPRNDLDERYAYYLLSVPQ